MTDQSAVEAANDSLYRAFETGDMDLMKIPVIVISGHASSEDAAQAIKLGATDFFEKPLNRERVLETGTVFFSENAILSGSASCTPWGGKPKGGVTSDKLTVCCQP